MPLIDITNPKIINFLLENYEKETNIRMRWLGLHKNRIQECATFKGKEKGYTVGDINKSLMIAGMPATTRDHIVADRYKFRKPTPNKVDTSIKIDATWEPIKPMITVKQDVKKLLLESRKDYLKERNKQSPEDKYNFIESINWEYGWKLNDSELKMKAPVYGLVAHLLHELEHSVGPQPDPPHYGSPDTTGRPCVEF